MGMTTWQRSFWRTSTGAVVAGLILVLGAGAAGAQNDTDDPALFDAGQAVFEQSCADCHGADGTGSVAGRPLVDIALQQPDRSVHVDSVTNGKGGMPAFGDILTAEEIDAAVTYVRLAFTAAEDTADDEAEELPATGVGTNSLLFVGLGLMLVGGVTVVAARPRPSA